MPTPAPCSPSSRYPPRTSYSVWSSCGSRCGAPGGGALLSWSDRLRVGELPFPASVVLFGARDYVVASSGWVLAWTVPARGGVQMAVFTLLGVYGAVRAGEGEA